MLASRPGVIHTVWLSNVHPSLAAGLPAPRTEPTVPPRESPPVVQVRQRVGGQKRPRARPVGKRRRAQLHLQVTKFISALKNAAPPNRKIVITDLDGVALTAVCEVFLEHLLRGGLTRVRESGKARLHAPMLADVALASPDLSGFYSEWVSTQDGQQWAQTARQNGSSPSSSLPLNGRRALAPREPT